MLQSNYIHSASLDLFRSLEKNNAQSNSSGLSNFSIEINLWCFLQKAFLSSSSETMYDVDVFAFHNIIHVCCVTHEWWW